MLNASINADGIVIDDLNTITTYIQNKLLTIYPNFNIDSNTPSGQIIASVSQLAMFMQEFAKQIYHSFDPDFAQGSRQDATFAINNITRHGASYTIQNIQITIDRDLNLQGLDDNFYNPDGTGYTVSDASGNQFILITSISLAGAGTYDLAFRCSALGAITTTPNTITTPITIIAGIIDINNPVSASIVGTNGESDVAFRIRRARSLAINSKGFDDSLTAALLNVPDLSQALVLDNRTSFTDANGIPPHSIWAIVNGGSAINIAKAMQAVVPPGPGMKGSQSFTLLRLNGLDDTFYWDYAISIPLYIRFNIQRTITGQIFNIPEIQSYIASNINNIPGNSNYDINQSAETSLLTTIASSAINQTGGGGVPLSLQISANNTTWTSYLASPLVNNFWNVVATNITITLL